MIIVCNAKERQPIDAGVLQCSPVSPILFAIYSSRLSKWVQERVLAAKRLSFVDNLGRVVTGHPASEIVTILERCAAQRI